jgi:hypothetical protein
LDLFVLFTCCYRDEYTKHEDSFFSIYLREWNSPICPKKIVFEEYLKNSNFKNLVKSNSDFDIDGCEKTKSQFNQRILRPNGSIIGQVNYDI